MSSSESDIEIKTTLPKKSLKKQPKSPSTEILKNDPKKMSTKEMIRAALKELNTRKGVSLYAIKRYIVDNFAVDVDRINFYIKKYIKTGVEAGIIVQTKGIGATGSFKLAPEKKVEKKKPAKKIEKVKTETVDKPKKKNDTKNPKMETKKSEAKSKTQKKEKSNPKKSTKENKATKEKESKITKEKVTKEGKLPNKVLKAAETTPAEKKKVMIKRKSIGSIIKPPKMKPKMKA